MTAEKLISDMKELVDKIRQLSEMDKEAALKEINKTQKLFGDVAKECEKVKDTK
jgi:hypothetical protein